MSARLVEKRAGHARMLDARGAGTRASTVSGMKTPVDDRHRVSECRGVFEKMQSRLGDRRARKGRWLSILGRARWERQNSYSAAY